MHLFNLNSEKYNPFGSFEFIFDKLINCILKYVLIVSAIGIPLLVYIGYAHWKKTAARKAEVDIFYELNHIDSPNRVVYFF